MLASSYPLLDAFLTLLWFFLFVIWIWILIMILIDIFRSHDINGWVKALWLIFILIFPLVGVIVYLIVRGGSMHQRSVRDAARSQQQFDDYVRQVAGQSTASELADLAKLKESGAITDDEYEKAKAKILS
jgi:hypothetical protein